MLMNEHQSLSIVKDIKAAINNSQFRAAVSVKREFVMRSYILV